VVFPVDSYFTTFLPLPRILRRGDKEGMGE